MNIFKNVHLIFFSIQSTDLHMFCFRKVLLSLDVHKHPLGVKNKKTSTSANGNWAKRKVTVIQIATLYNHGKKESISEDALRR